MMTKLDDYEPLRRARAQLDGIRQQREAHQHSRPAAVDDSAVAIAVLDGGTSALQDAEAQDREAQVWSSTAKRLDNAVGEGEQRVKEATSEASKALCVAHLDADRANVEAVSAGLNALVAAIDKMHALRLWLTGEAGALLPPIQELRPEVRFENRLRYVATDFANLTKDYRAGNV
jgi:hypothetical protein